MALPYVSHNKANATCNGIILIGLGILFYTGFWWPGILLVIGTALVTKQFLRGRYYDMGLTTLIFGGITIGALYDWSFSYFLPVMFTLAGIYLIFSEWFVKRERVGEEELEDMKKEIEDVEHPE